MRSTEARAIALLLLLAGCRAPDTGAGSPRRKIVATFSGAVDATTGTVSIRDDSLPAAAAGTSRAALEIPVVQDGVPGSGPPDTIELVTESVATVPGGCGAVDGFEGSIRLGSFYAGAVLTNVHVELVSLTPTGREACNSAPPEALSDAFGLFDYGTVGRDGSGFNAVLRPWRFRLPDQTAFTFRGHVVADLVTADSTPPSTVAVPAAGTYAPGRSVELSCSDVETGCAATYYTTDATIPTRASPVYTAPIPIASSFTLRWFSVDYWGNAGPLQSAAYALDATPPSVVSVTPTSGGIGVSTASTVAVTFSEPVDPATVVSSTFSVSGPAGAVGGAIVSDPTHRTFTFTPAAALQAEAQYAVTVTSGVRDLAGNALASGFSSTFYTVTVRQTGQPATSATLVKHGLVYDGSGNALSAWSATTQGGSAVVFATYSAASKTWSAAQVLATDRGNSVGNPIRVATDGSQFLVAWCTTSGVRAVRVQNGAASAIADLTTAGASLSSDGLTVSATASNRFLVVLSYQGNIAGWSWNGTAWSASASIGSGGTVILSGSTVYYLGSDNASVLGSTFGSAWSAPVAIATTTVAQGSPVGLSVARASSTLVAYRTTKGHVWAMVGSGTSFGSPWDVSGTGSETTTPLAVAAGALGTECAVAWVTASGKAYGAFQNGGFWPASPTLLFPSSAVDVSLAGYSSGFVAAFTVRDAGSSIASLWAVPSAGGSGARSWGSSVLAENGASMAAEPAVGAVGTSAVIHWTQADSVAHQVMLRSYAAGALGATETPSASPVVPGSPTGVRLAVNGAGEVLAVWTQDDDGSPSVFAAVHRASGWSAAVRAVTHGYWPDVASNGAGFLVVAAVDSATTPSARNIVSVPFTAGAFGSAEVVASGTTLALPRVASDGQGYAAIWLSGATVQAAIRNAGAWLATRSLGSGNPATVAGRSGEYLFLWVDGSSGNVGQVRASGAGASWTWGATSWPPGCTIAGDVVAAAGTDGFLAVCRNGFLTGWKVVGGVTGTSITLGTGTKPCDAAQIAVSGNRYLVGWNCSDSLKTAETDGIAAPVSVSHVTGAPGIEKAALGFAIAGAPGGRFRMLYSRVPSQFVAANVYARDSASGAWGTTTAIDNRPESTQSTVALGWDGGTYLALWGQTTAANAVVDDLVTWWAF